MKCYSFGKLLWICLIAMPAHCVMAGNPMVPGIGLTDPHIVIYGNRAYLYATHDFSPENKSFVMKDWWVWSSADLVHWQQAGTLKPEDTFIGKPFNDCWATFGIGKNGKYYWYFSAGPTEIGVVVADSPAGPWHDPLGKPLLPKSLTPTEQRDPDLMVDDDGKAYMVYGTFNYFIVRLNDDMISLGEKPQPVQIDNPYGPYGAGKTDDKPSLHKRNGIYYLSWSSFYAMATNIYGPYSFKGSVIAAETVAPEFRKGDIWHDRHGNFFTWHDQWFYSCNDKSQPGRSEYYRDCCISYLHYRDNGEMAPVRLDRTGVGEYDAAQPDIEAEDYFAAELADIKECPAGGFEVRGLRAGSHLLYPNIKNFPRNATIAFRVAAGQPEGGTVEVRENAKDGRLLGSCHIHNTGGWDQYQSIACPLNNASGTKNLCLVFKGGKAEFVRLDKFIICN